MNSALFRTPPPNAEVEYYVTPRVERKKSYILNYMADDFACNSDVGYSKQDPMLQDYG